MIRYIKMKNINPLYLTINKINGYIKESHENKYLALVSTNKSIINESHENKYLALVSTNKSIIRIKYLLDRQLLTWVTMRKNI